MKTKNREIDRCAHYSPVVYTEYLTAGVARSMSLLQTVVSLICSPVRLSVCLSVCVLVGLLVSTSPVLSAE